MRFTLLTILAAAALLLAPRPACGQIYENIYRPSEPQWMQLSTPRFQVVYPQGADSSAIRTARILESEYRDIQELVAGELNDFPVVLNTHNDLSNAFVTNLHFRIEAEVPPIRGKSMNPGTGGWLEHMIPHELVHAFHLSVTDPPSITRLVDLFSSDIARGMHMTVPAGMLEGLAVYHESRAGTGLGGRGDYPYFTNRLHANFASGGRWQFDQLMQPSRFSRPFNRVYIGGHEFTEWLHQNHGFDATREVIRRTANYPFLGFGTNLRMATGKWPHQLHEAFVQDYEEKQARRAERIRQRGPTDQHRTLESDYQGFNVHRPVWLNDRQILYHASHYNRRPGFWVHDVETGEKELVAESASVEDFLYNLNEERDALLFADYRRHPYYHRTRISDLYVLDLNSGERKRLTYDQRLFAPVWADSTIWALQTHYEHPRWVALDGQSGTGSRDEREAHAEAAERGESGGHGSPDNPELRTLVDLSPDKLVEVAPSPDDSTIAVIANRNGMQGLWLLEKPDEQTLKQNPPDVHLPGATIFDATWHPGGNRLLFTSDYQDVMNIYEWDLQEDRLHQVTNTLFNGFEPSYAPDGDAIAFVVQEGDLQKPAILSRSDFLGREIGRPVWRYNRHARPPEQRAGDELLEASGAWTRGPYRQGLSWLAPRMVYPVLDQAGDNVMQWGAGVASGNLLRSHSYAAQVTRSHTRIWPDLTYRYSGYYPGFRLRLSGRPLYTNEQWFERQNAGLQVPLRWLRDYNIRRSALFVTPGMQLSRIRGIQADGTPETGWGSNTALTLSAQYQHRLQQNIRDAQPNTGSVLYTGLLQDVATGREQLRHGIRSGAYTYITPAQRWNQSLRLGAELVWQNEFVFGSSGLFATNPGRLLEYPRRFAGLHARYTIPLWHPDRGSLILPTLLERFYGVLFAHTTGSFPPGGNATGEHILSPDQTHSILGAGLRVDFRVFNMPLNLGVSLTYDPGRNRLDYILGSF